MRAVFIGHQTWMISDKNTNLLFDPVLDNFFGHSEGINFRLYPPREVNIKSMPIISAIFLSHEHLDHFHLPSLSLLNKNTPFFVSILMPRCVINAIEQLGFRVSIINMKESVQIEDLKVTFYPAPNETVFWEKRVTQFYIETVSPPHHAIFIGVDALVSDEFIETLSQNDRLRIDAIIVANNSQLAPSSAVGTYSNLLPINQGRFSSPFPGVELLNNILIEYLKQIPHVKHVIICGNGFMSAHESFGPFLLSDNKELADIANKLNYFTCVHGPYPGEELTFNKKNITFSKASWIKLLTNEHVSLKKKLDNYIQKKIVHQTTFPPILDHYDSSEEEHRAVNDIEKEFVYLARALAMDEGIGYLILSTNEYLLGKLDHKRILFRFLKNNNRSIQYAFDISTTSFIKDTTNVDEILEKFPYGIEVNLVDFHAVCLGRLQIWDLAGKAMRSWYIGSPYENLVVFLYKYFGEQIRPDLASKIYNRILSKLIKNNTQVLACEYDSSL